MNIIRLTMGLSLNDCYWIVEDGFRKHSRCNLPNKRLRLIEKEKQKRAGALLDQAEN